MSRPILRSTGRHCLRSWGVFGRLRQSTPAHSRSWTNPPCARSSASAAKKASATCTSRAIGCSEGRFPALRARFSAQGVRLHVKIGVETFDADYRERVLDKGIDAADPAEIAADFDDCCLLFGPAGQTAESMARDIRTGLAYFGPSMRQIMVPNTTSVKPDQAARDAFIHQVYPLYRDEPRVDILLDNTDFGVGELE